MTKDPGRDEPQLRRFDASFGLNTMHGETAILEAC